MVGPNDRLRPYSTWCCARAAEYVAQQRDAAKRNCPSLRVAAEAGQRIVFIMEVLLLLISV
jgi:hypothetical protein